MRTPASIARHPIHPMLVPFPIGLWVFSFICDLIFAYGSGAPIWKTLALYTMVGGFIGALAAAIPGLIDLLSLSDAAIKKTAITHMSINLVVVALYAINIWLRLDSKTNVGTPLVLSVIAVAMLVVSGWLGGKMVHEAGVGVDVAPR